MHELTLSESIVNLVVECARIEQLRAVTRVVLEIGTAAGVEIEALRFCFDLVTKDTLAQGAVLAIDVVSLQARCRSCAANFIPDHAVSACPQCGSYAIELVCGRELRVKSIDGE